MSDGLHIRTNAAAVADGFDLAATRIAGRTVAVVRHHGMLLQTRVKARASGRPGPRAITGHYRRSIGLALTYGVGDKVAAHVGSNAVQARRLEQGFFDVDSLGRHYEQPPFPHFAPAHAQTEPEFLTACAGLAMDAL